MNSTATMAIFSALALGHSLFLAGHFWSPVRKRPGSFFLALLLTALAVRIMKSVLIILLPKSPDIIPAVGLIGLSAIGPSFWLYIKSFKNPLFKAKNTLTYHYIWTAALIPLFPVLNDDQIYIAYCISVAHMFIYLIGSAVIVSRRYKSYDVIEKRWLLLLMGSTVLIWATFFVQLLIEAFLTYVIVTVVSAVVIYGLSLWAGKKARLFVEHRRRFSEKTAAEMSDIGKQVESLFKEKMIYTDSDLTIRKISAHLLQPEYLVSRAINAHFEKSFPELLNQYRIAHATRLIESKAYENLSIEGIGYESGYNSISAFYRAFKDLKGVTPARFRKEAG